MEQDTKLNVTFSGCGFLGIYHVGVISSLKQCAPDFHTKVWNFGGTSAGALAATTLLFDVDLVESVNFVMTLANKARQTLGPLSPSFDPVNIIRKLCLRFLPENAHEVATGRLHISLTRIKDWQNVVVSEYTTKEDLIDALVCTSFVPFYSGIMPPKFRGVAYIDGGFTDNLPQHFSGTTITVSPFSGESDICPDDSNESQTHFDLRNTSVKFTSQNLYRMSRAFFPPAPDVLSDMCRQGFKDALKYLHIHYPEMLNIGIARVHIPECCVDSDSDDEAASVCSCTTARSRLTEVESTIAERNTILDTVVPHRLNEILQGTKDLIGECDLMSWYMIKVFLRIVRWLAKPCVYTMQNLGCFANEIVLWLIPKIKEISNQNYYTSLLVNMALEVFYTYTNMHQCQRHPSLNEQDMTDMEEATAKIREAQRWMRAVPLEQSQEPATTPAKISKPKKKKVSPPNMEYLGLSPRKPLKKEEDENSPRKDSFRETLHRHLSSEDEWANKSYSCQDFLYLELNKSHMLCEERRDSFDEFVYSFVDSEDDGVFSDSSTSTFAASTPVKNIARDSD